MSNTQLSPIEQRVDANQRLVAFSAATGSILLAIQHIVIEAHGPEWLSVSSSMASAAAWLLFLVAMFKNQRIFKTEDGKAYRAQLEGDEILQRIQKEAFTWGFAVMLMIQVVMILTFSFFDPHFLSIPVAATSTMAGGIGIAVLRYQILWSR